MLELDWQGTNCCLYNQVDSTKKFKKFISKELGFEDSKKEGGCDLQIICRDISGVNLGVGYHFFHKVKEKLDVYEWENTFCKLKELLALPQERYRSKIFSKYIRYARKLVGKALRVLKLRK